MHETLIHSAMDTWIPQRRSMQLIDRIIQMNDDMAVAEVDVPFDGIFTRRGEVPAWIGIEYMAQTVSAWAGRGERRLSGGAPKLGLLLGSRRYIAHRAAFPAGAVLRIEAHCELMGDNGLGMFECLIQMDGEQMASARLAVFEPEDAAAFFRDGGFSA